MMKHDGRQTYPEWVQGQFDLLEREVKVRDAIIDALQKRLVLAEHNNKVLMDALGASIDLVSRLRYIIQRIGKRLKNPGNERI